jgi:ubiquinone/menaquinone biosynthesis C-methylase UbiE
MSKQHFDSSAQYYAKYRFQYPQQFYQLLQDKCHLTGEGRMLDLGCGTGFLAISLSEYFYEVLGVDVSEPMLQQAAIEAERAGRTNIQWLQSRAEDLTDQLGNFDLITIGRALHWMDEKQILTWVHNHLQSSGCLVLIGEYDRCFNNGEGDWQQKLFEIVEKYTEKQLYKRHKIERLWKDILEQYNFKKIESYLLPFKKHRNIDHLIGFVLSTSFSSPQVINNQIEEFKQELHQELLKINPSNDFIEEQRLSVAIGFK